MNEKAAIRVAALRDELEHHNHLYYTEAKPVISDQQYDRLLRELVDLETANPELLSPDSPSQRVGGKPIDGFVSVRHARPMMSISNTYDAGEVVAWAKHLRERLDGAASQFVVEPKIDGVAASLRYERGKLVLVATRGDGNIGDDITASGRTIASIPLRLQVENGKPPEVLEVRGEIYMPNATFQAINLERAAAGEETFKNPRNLTTGTLKQLDPKLTAKRRLQFTVHGLGEHDLDERTDSYWDALQLLKKWRLPVPAVTKRVATIEAVMREIESFEKVRGTLAFQTDGMVVKVDSFAQREAAGVTSKSPRWVTAYKYAAEQQQTVLNAVDWQVGKGGTLTPVARMEPVFVAGSTVSNATLHNIDRIHELDLHLGDTLVIEKAGEVIPYVRQVVREKRPPRAPLVKPPTRCPSCGTTVFQEPGTPQIRCPNEDCPAQLSQRLIWFVGRGQMNIDGLGEKLIEQLIAAGHLKDFADLYRLTETDVASLVRDVQLGEKKAAEIVDGIAAIADDEWRAAVDGLKAHRDEPLPERIGRLVKSLGLKGLGERTVEQLVEAGLVKSVGDLRRVDAASVAELTQTVKVGPKSAAKVVENIASSKSAGLARALAGLGVRLVGSTASTAFAPWAGSIERLRAASLEELAAVLSKNPDAQREAERKEREYATTLFTELHPEKSTGGASLFGAETTVPKTSAETFGTTQELLEARDAGLARGTKLGKGRVALIAEAFTTPDELLAASADEITDTLLQGRAVARSLYDYLHSARGKRTIDDLAAVGVNLTAEATAPVERSEWTGKTVVVTGSFESATRNELKERLAAMGAHVSESVSAKTDAVFVGTDAGSKYDKAVKLGLPIHGEDVVRAVMGK